MPRSPNRGQAGQGGRCGHDVNPPVCLKFRDSTWRVSVLTVPRRALVRSMLRRQMPMGTSAVTMSRSEFHIDQIQLSVTHAAFGDDLFGELAHEFD